MVRRTATVALIVLSILSGIGAFFLARDYFIRRDALANEAFAAAQSQAVQAATDISAEFGELMSIAQGIADELSAGTLAYTSIETRMRGVVADRPDIDGLSVTFQPFVYDPEQRLFQTYMFKQDDGSFDVLRGATYDYTLPTSEQDSINTDWYLDTINDGAQWHEPFFAVGAQKILVEYGVPFYLTGQGNQSIVAGVVSIDYTLEDVRDLMRELELGETGYGFVMSDQGTFLTHPVAEYVVNRTFFDITSDERLIAAGHNALQGNAGFIEADDLISGETTWYFFEPIGATGWTMGIVLNKAQFEPDSSQTARDQMTVALVASLTVFLVLTTIYHTDRFQFTNFWTMSATFSILCVILIVLAWVLTNRLEPHVGVSITSQAELDRYLQSIEPSPGSTEEPVQIPTGILVQALQFPDPTSVTINGYIWQKYPEESDVQQGFTLPQRIGEEATIEEVRRETVDGMEVIVWYIGVTVRQTYDVMRFPFDHRSIAIRIAPADLTTNVVLTPDLAGYDLVNPRLLPGVDPQATINNWNFQSSRFSYLKERSSTNFGLSDQLGTGSTYELSFNIQAQRVYLGPFIAYLLPGLIAAVMTFAYLMSGRRVGDNDEIVGALNYAAAIFFVVAIVHTALRDQIAAVGITYMEHIYLLLYIAIVAVAANTFMVARFPLWSIVRYRDNLVPKVLYWPIFAGVMLIATLLIFVY
jgi:hypothetical protein